MWWRGRRGLPLPSVQSIDVMLLSLLVVEMPVPSSPSISAVLHRVLLVGEEASLLPMTILFPACELWWTSTRW